MSTIRIDTPPRQVPRIALDAMGGDFAPEATVWGAIETQNQGNCQVLLVGDPPAIKSELKKIEADPSTITIVPSEGWITEDEHPVQALRSKPRSSILVATRLLKDGMADAMVSMGSTGATMASATMMLGTLEGLERPCLGGPFLGLAPNTVVVDMGSNVDCRPHMLLDFAVMGSVFARHYLGIPSPRVGLLSLGAEEGKGNRQVREAYPVLSDSNLNFIGNVEGMDFFTGKADVIVCDGFVGNVLMKYTEGLGAAMSSYIRSILVDKLSQQELEPLVTRIWEVNNLPKKMGGPLFGVNGTVVIGHGASGPQGVAGAIDTARRCVELDLLENMRSQLAASQAVARTP